MFIGAEFVERFLLANSPVLEFHEFKDIYLHYFHQKSVTGLQLELLQKYLFIPLDIFYECLQNKGIRNKLDAWLAFLCSDDPEIIFLIINKYPEFKDMYAHIYDICQNIEKVLGMFSKELRELDRNTVQLMIDEMYYSFLQTILRQRVEM